MSENLKLRLLQKDEFYRLKKIFKKMGSDLDPAEILLAVAAAETDDHRLVGVRCISHILHAGPIWVSDEHQNKGLGTQLHLFLDNHLKELGVPGYYSNPTSEAAIHLCEKLGMEAIPGKLFRKGF